ncbi:hypothetical protein AGR7A_pAt30073 [Agrobacterium deltaense NCPPB 1641]|uniref:Uncharacterized protein n=1 Tax=Agrobacterium deltaense NCPPB 1641 TaxID=1183425 RepID=A0A1S7UBR6_9HYPH|nr:hypothetical protein AGR7A_pAt30073 [Agrobacterium deltaense NCPPB 1641]
MHYSGTTLRPRGLCDLFKQQQQRSRLFRHRRKPLYPVPHSFLEAVDAHRLGRSLGNAPPTVRGTLELVSISQLGLLLETIPGFVPGMDVCRGVGCIAGDLHDRLTKVMVGPAKPRLSRLHTGDDSFSSANWPASARPLVHHAVIGEPFTDRIDVVLVEVTRACGENIGNSQPIREILKSVFLHFEELLLGAKRRSRLAGIRRPSIRSLLLARTDELDGDAVRIPSVRAELPFVGTATDLDRIVDALEFIGLVHAKSSIDVEHIKSQVCEAMVARADIVALAIVRAQIVDEFDLVTRCLNEGDLDVSPFDAGRLLNAVGVPRAARKKAKRQSVGEKRNQSLEVRATGRKARMVYSLYNITHRRVLVGSRCLSAPVFGR